MNLRQVTPDPGFNELKKLFAGENKNNRNANWLSYDMFIAYCMYYYRDIADPIFQAANFEEFQKIFPQIIDKINAETINADNKKELLQIAFMMGLAYRLNLYHDDLVKQQSKNPSLFVPPFYIGRTWLEAAKAAQTQGNLTNQKDYDDALNAIIKKIGSTDSGLAFFMGFIQFISENEAKAAIEKRALVSFNPEAARTGVIRPFFPEIKDGNLALTYLLPDNRINHGIFNPPSNWQQVIKENELPLKSLPADPQGRTYYFDQYLDLSNLYQETRKEHYTSRRLDDLYNELFDTENIENRNADWVPYEKFVVFCKHYYPDIAWPIFDNPIDNPNIEFQKIIEKIYAKNIDDDHKKELLQIAFMMGLACKLKEHHNQLEHLSKKYTLPLPHFYIGRTWLAATKAAQTQGDLTSPKDYDKALNSLVGMFGSSSDSGFFTGALQFIDGEEAKKKIENASTNERKAGVFRPSITQIKDGRIALTHMNAAGQIDHNREEPRKSWPPPMSQEIWQSKANADLRDLKCLPADPQNKTYLFTECIALNERYKKAQEKDFEHPRVSPQTSAPTTAQATTIFKKPADTSGVPVPSTEEKHKKQETVQLRKKPGGN